MFLPLYDRLGKRLPTVTGTSFSDLFSDLSNQDRDHARSLQYHVVALTADGASMPVTLEVDTEPLRRWYSGGIAVLDATAYEGTDADLVFEVMLRPKPQGTVTVDYATVAGSATAGTDYTSKSGTLTFSRYGFSIKEIRVPVANDSIEDSGETLTLRLSNPSAIGIVRNDAVGTIFNSDEPAANSPATGAPTISGTAQAGQTLTARTSGISDADGLINVSFDHQWLADGTDIAGATGSTYDLTDSEVGKTIQVKVSFTDNANNDETLTSAATAAVVADPGPLTGFTVVDASANPQTVLATLAYGDTLTLDDPQGGSFGIRVDTKTGADIGSVRLQMTGGRSEDQEENYAPYSLHGDHGEDDLHGGNLPVGSYTLTATAYSEGSLNGEELGALSVSFTVKKTNTPATGAPIISGTAQVDEMLTVDTTGIADADGPTNPTFSYQWIRNDGGTDTDINGKTAATYTVVSEDVGKTIQVKVSFTDNANNKETLTSEATAAVVATVPTAPQSVTVVKGDQIQELDVSWQVPSSSGGTAVTGYRVQWKEAADNWDTAADVSQATVTGTSHTITGLTGGVAYTVRVIATNNAGDGPASVETTGTPAGGVSEQQDEEPENNEPIGLPTISGTAQAGQTLAASTSGITDADGLINVSFDHQWLADGADIPGATGPSYDLTTSEVGKTIQVKVSFTDNANNKETLISESTAVVAATVPGAPEHLNVVPHYAEALDLSWHAPDSGGGSDITGYRVQWKEAGDSWDTVADVSEESVTGITHTITGLTGGVRYTVRVAAVNRVGEGPASAEATGTAAKPLIASLENEPQSHDGATAFTFELHFSEDLANDFSYETLRDDAFSVSGGEVNRAKRINPDSDTRSKSWLITATPSGDGDFVVTLPITPDCNANGAICTEDGRKLSIPLELTVSGPGG